MPKAPFHFLRAGLFGGVGLGTRMAPALCVSASDPKASGSLSPTSPHKCLGAGSVIDSDGPRERADSPVSRGILLRTRAKGVCFHIITGQLS